MLEEQDAYGGQGNIDHPPAPSHVQVVRGVRGGTQDTLSNLHGGSVGVSYPHLEGGKQIIFFHFTARASAMVHSSCHHSCELEELLHHARVAIVLQGFVIH